MRLITNEPMRLVLILAPRRLRLTRINRLPNTITTGIVAVHASTEIVLALPEAIRHTTQDSPIAVVRQALATIPLVVVHGSQTGSHRGSPCRVSCVERYVGGVVAVVGARCAGTVAVVGDRP